MIYLYFELVVFQIFWPCLNWLFLLLLFYVEGEGTGKAGYKETFWGDGKFCLLINEVVT